MERQRRFSTAQSHCDRWKKRDKGVCGWKIRAGMRLKSITDRGWMCPGVTSSGVRILSVGTLFCTSIKTIWCLNLTDRIRDAIEMLKELYHGIGMAKNCNLDQIECNGPYWVNSTSYGKILKNAPFITSVQTLCTFSFTRFCLFCITFEATCLVKFNLITSTTWQ